MNRDLQKERPESKVSPKVDRKQNLKSTLGLVVALIFGAALALMMSSSGALLERGDPAPPFQLPSVDASGGGEVSLASLHGKVVVLEFWSTSCPPCLRQMQDLEVIHQQLGGQDVVILGINTEGASQAEIRDFVQARGVPYPVLVDSGTAAESYRVDRLPTLYIIDKEGRVRWATVGFTPHDELVEILRELI